MAADVQTGTDTAELRKLLVKSKQEPVNCAFAGGADKSLALLVLDRTKGPKTLERELTKQFPDAFNARFGTAVVDATVDAKLVRFCINKPVSGMARRLVKTLKGTGFTKVEIVLEDGTPVELGSDEAAEPAAAAPAAAPASAPAAAPAPAPGAAPAAAPETAKIAAVLAQIARRIPELAGDAGVRETWQRRALAAGQRLAAGDAAGATAMVQALGAELAAAAQIRPTAAAPPPLPDAGALRVELAGLIARIQPLADAARKAALAGLATQANAALKGGNVTDAAAQIAALRQQLDAAAPAQPLSVLRVWQTAKDAVDAQFEQLAKAFRATGHPLGEAIAEKGLPGLSKQLVVPMVAALMDYEHSDGPVRAKARTKLVSALDTMRDVIASHPALPALERNPFGVAVSIRATLGEAAGAIARQVGA